MKRILLIGIVATLMGAQHATAQNRVKNLYTETQTLKVEQVAETDATVQLNRYLFAGYNTLCLPMTLDAQQLEAAAPGIKVERFSAIRQEGTTLALYFTDCTSEGIQAGVPYLVFSPKAQYLHAKNTESNGVRTELQTIRMTDNDGNQVSFGSSWNLRVKEGLYGIPAKQNVAVLESVLVSTTANQSFLPTRCGFAWEKQGNAATALEIRHAAAGETTAISQLNADNAQTSVYDLNGRRTNSTAKGLYIKNGKKMVK